MNYEVQPSRTTPDEWVVEAIDHESEGENYAAAFSGPGAKERSEEYAAWKNVACRQRALRDGVVRAVRASAGGLDGVTSAYVIHSGVDFLLTGPEWTVELGDAAAELAASMQAHCAPNGETYINGGFLDMDTHPGSLWEQVYP